MAGDAGADLAIVEQDSSEISLKKLPHSQARAKVVEEHLTGLDWREELDTLMVKHHREVMLVFDTIVSKTRDQARVKADLVCTTPSGREGDTSIQSFVGVDSHQTFVSSKGGAPDAMRGKLSVEAMDAIRRNKAKEVSAERKGTMHFAASEQPPQSRFKKFVQSPKFESFFAFVILLNAVFIGIETDILAQKADPNEDTDPWSFIVSSVFTFIFSVEWTCRIIAKGRHFFGIKEIWNWLDTLVVIASLGEFLTVVILGRNRAQHNSGTQFRILRIIRITKLLRIVRATKLVRLIRALRTLVHQILSTIRSLVWVVVLLVMLIFLFALIFTQAATSYRQDGTEPISTALETYWLTLPRSMQTLFMSVTSGVSWKEVITPLSNMGQIYTAIFLGYIFFVQMAVLNVVTGVFCQTAIDSAAHDQELVTQAVLAERAKYTANLKRIFHEIGSDDCGITFLEFEEKLGNQEVRAYLDSLGLDTTDVWTLFKILDVDQGNVIDLDEFVAGCLRMKGFAKGFDIAKLCYEQKVFVDRFVNFMHRTDCTLSVLQETVHGISVTKAEHESMCGDEVAVRTVI